MALSRFFSLRPADIMSLYIHEFDLYAAAVDKMEKGDNG